jgi:cysteinyl-tRNA synthetase
MRLFNSLTKEYYELPHTKKLNVYICGPTVYKRSHLGHLRTFLTFDILRRALIYLKYDIHWTMNVTDINQKINSEYLKSNFDGSYSDFADEMTELFIDDLNSLNILPPNQLIRVSDSINDIINYIQVIYKNGYAYESDGSVYIDVQKLEEDGKNIDIFKRASIDDIHDKVKEYIKKDSRDFALWKKGNDDDENIKFDSPWGRGFPGWHIECSAMIHKIYGNQLNIHCGGIDLIHPHHNNEYVQHIAYTKNDTWAELFLHTGHVYINNEKMSNSLNNIITIRQLLEKYSSNVIRMVMFSVSWHKQIDFNENLFIKAESIMNYIQRFYLKIEILITMASGSKKMDITKIKNDVHEYLNDNLNTYDIIEYFKKIINEIYHDVKLFDKENLTNIINFIIDFLKFMGFTFMIQNKPEYEDILKILIKSRNEIRNIAQKTTDKETKKQLYKLCDEIRDNELKKINICLEDVSNIETLWHHEI